MLTILIARRRGTLVNTGAVHGTFIFLIPTRYARCVRRLVVALVLLAIAAAPASAAPPASKGLINHRDNGHIDSTLSCSAYRYPTRSCSRSIGWIGPTPAQHKVWWPYAAGILALLSATAVGLRRARASTPA
jgi:hypothetical protein